MLYHTFTPFSKISTPYEAADAPPPPAPPVSELGGGALTELETYLYAKYKYETAVAGVARGLTASANDKAAEVRDEVKQLRLTFERQRLELERSAVEFDRQERQLEAMKDECRRLEGYIDE